MAPLPASWEIVFYADSRGRSPVVEWMDDLPVKERAKIDRLLHLLSCVGTRLGGEHARALSDCKPLWELRP